MLARIAALLHKSQATLAEEITPCSSTVPAPCWTGEPYQSVPVATHLSRKVILAVTEHREDYPGIAIETVTYPHYPHGALAGQVLGRVPPPPSASVLAIHLRRIRQRGVHGAPILQ